MRAEIAEKRVSPDAQTALLIFGFACKSFTGASLKYVLTSADTFFYAVISAGLSSFSPPVTKPIVTNASP
jgi:hypothetical protein